MVTALDKTYGLKLNQDTLYFINDKDLTSFDFPDNLQFIIMNTDKSQLPAYAVRSCCPDYTVQ